MRIIRAHEFAFAAYTAMYGWWTLRALAVVAIMAFVGLTGCTTAPVDRPCGVIRDDLKTVTATTPAGQQRLDVHYERGRAAKCW